MSQFLTRHEAADEIGVTVRTLDRWIGTGQLPAYRRVGGRTYIRHEDVATIMRPISETAA